MQQINQGLRGRVEEWGVSDVERLEEVKSNWDYSCESGGFPEPDDVEWLISTVERQEKSNRELDKLNMKLMKENARLRKALEKAKRELSDDESIIDCARNAYNTVSQALKE